jgi:hypothetical protein
MNIQRYSVFIKVARNVEVPVTGGVGYATKHDGYDTHRVVVEVDVERLALELGTKAVQSKRGKAVEAGGAVVVRKAK